MHLFLRPELLSRLIFSVPDGRNYYVQATAQQKARRALPEAIIRQLFVLSLLHDYKYPEDRIQLEWKIQVGGGRIRADIVVLDEEGSVLVIIEIKVETDQHSMAQLKSYMALTGAKYGALISASKRECQMRSDRGVFSAIRDIPIFDVTSLPLTDILPGTTTADSAFPNDGQIPPEGTAKATQEFPLKQLIGIEQFERVSNTVANITIKGITLRLPIEEIDSYKKLRMQFMQKGLVLVPRVRQDEWFALFSHLLESNPVPATVAEHVVTPIAMLGQYLNEFAGQRLVVTTLNAGMTAVEKRPLQSLTQRYEKDNALLFIDRQHLKHWMETHHFNYREIRQWFFDRRILVSVDARKILGAGTDMTGASIPCWKIRANHPELGVLISEAA
jgi:hypothetical protein